MNQQLHTESLFIPDRAGNSEGDKFSFFSLALLSTPTVVRRALPSLAPVPGSCPGAVSNHEGPPSCEGRRLPCPEQQAAFSAHLRCVSCSLETNRHTLACMCAIRPSLSLLHSVGRFECNALHSLMHLNISLSVSGTCLWRLSLCWRSYVPGG